MDVLRPDTPCADTGPLRTPFTRLCARRDRTPSGAADLAQVAQLAGEMTNGRADDAVGVIPSGYTYWGQLVAHDLSLAVAAPEGHDPVVHNARSGRLDLECVLGRGPRVDGHLYRRSGAPVLMLVERPEDDVTDVLRRPDGTAVIADLRNDDNAIVLQLHVALASAYNRLVSARYAAHGDRLRAYAEARRELVAVYQRVTLTDHLKRVLDKRVAGRIDRLVEHLSDPTTVPHGGASANLPLEFSFAALRYGHSMVRREYTLNDGLGRAFPMMPRRSVSADDGHLRGGKPLVPRWTIDWRHFFDDHAPAPQCQMAKPIGPHLSSSLGDVRVGPGKTSNLAALTLLGERTVGLPGLHDVVRSLGLALPEHPDGHTSLWWAILQEAASQGGTSLGPSGSALVCSGIEASLSGCAWRDAASPRRAPASHLGDAEISTVGDLVRFGVHGAPRPGRRNDGRGSEAG